MSSAERPIENLKYARVVQHTCAGTVRKGFAVKNSSDSVVEAAAVGDNAFGIALDAGVNLGKIRVAYFGYPAIVQALVGTGGCTKHAPAKFVSDGATDATVGGGTTKLRVYGQWLETAVAVDFAALNIADAAWTVGS